MSTVILFSERFPDSPRSCWSSWASLLVVVKAGLVAQKDKHARGVAMLAVCSFSRAVIGSKRALLTSFEDVVVDAVARDQAWTVPCPDTGASVSTPNHFYDEMHHLRRRRRGCDNNHMERPPDRPALSALDRTLPDTAGRGLDGRLEGRGGGRRGRAGRGVCAIRQADTRQRR